MEDYEIKGETQETSAKQTHQEVSIERPKTETIEPNPGTQNASSVVVAPPQPTSVIQTKSTKFCANCGSKIDKNAAMCPNCGVMQSKASTGKNIKFCSNCGSEVDIKAEICPKCGVRQPGSIGISGEKSPVVAAFLSFLIVGLGQVYVGKPKRGIVLFGAGIVFAFTSFLIIPFFGVLACWIGGIYDAYKLAQGEPGLFSFIDRYTNEL
jgi:TM2 domain-containing membrane protein YozV/RNA polymerase subunit RPABC4/transcription elongation factor Spt4